MTITVRYFLRDTDGGINREWSDPEMPHARVVEEVLIEVRGGHVVVYPVPQDQADVKRTRIIPPHAIRFVDVIEERD